MKNKLLICGLMYDIIYSNTLSRDFSALGMMSRNDLKIYLESSLDRELQKKTLIHEIIEVINSDLDLQLDHKTICCLETALFNVIKDNNILEWKGIGKNEIW